MVQAFSWKKGKKLVVVEKEHVGKQQLYLRPLALQKRAGGASVIEAILILEEGIDLSLFFQQWAQVLSASLHIQ